MFGNANIVLLIIVINSPLTLQKTGFNEKYIINEYESNWLMKSDQLKKYTNVVCGKDAKQIISISITQNRIYQFTPDHSVVIYEDAVDRYSPGSYLNLTNGYKVPLDKIIPSKLLDKILPQIKLIIRKFPDESLERQSMAVIRHQNGFIWHARLTLTPLRFWKRYYVHDFPVADWPQVDPFYHMAVYRMNVIPISGGHRYYLLTWNRKDTLTLFMSHHIIYNTVDLNDIINDAYVCMVNDVILLSSDIHRRNCTSLLDQSKRELFSEIRYGFVSFMDLVLVAPNRNFVLLIHRNILEYFDETYPVRKLTYEQFFKCN